LRFGLNLVDVEVSHFFRASAPDAIPLERFASQTSSLAAEARVRPDEANSLSVYTFHQVTPELLTLHGRSREEALRLIGCTEFLDALLPEEFVRDFTPKVIATPDWLGFWILLDGVVSGSGGYRAAPKDGVTEIGYGIHEPFWGRGAATALCEKLVDHAFANGAKTVRAHTLHTGDASQTVLKKNGFAYVGDFEEPDDGLVMRWERGP
jgi:[ribosomal protein S5]-alanine N-acetyltransferase